MKKMTIKFNLQLPIETMKTEDEKWFIALCPIFDVSSQGKTEKKAVSNLTEALTLFLISCYERGTLDEVLKESGFEPAYNTTTRRKPQYSINVPLPFLVPNFNTNRCHV